MHISRLNFHLFLGAAALNGARSPLPGYPEEPEAPRLAAGFTQEELAELMVTSKSTITRHGERQDTAHGLDTKEMDGTDGDTARDSAPSLQWRKISLDQSRSFYGQTIRDDTPIQTITTVIQNAKYIA